MQFQVPQNIDLEDKIIGPLTLKQFIILVAGGMIDYIWYTIFDAGLFILLFIPTTLFTLALVFARVQDQPFPKFLGSLALFVLKPKILTWGKTPPLKIVEFQKREKEQILHPKHTSESQIQKLSIIIDTQGWGAEKRPDNAKTPEKKEDKPKLNPQISQPQAFSSFNNNQPASPTNIAPEQVKTAARQVATQSNMPQNKAMAAADQIISQLQQKPAQEVQASQAKQPLFKKIFEKIGSGFVDVTPAPKQTDPQSHPVNSQMITPNDVESDLQLQDRVKTHETIKPKINVGAASENTLEDPLDKIEP